MKRPSSRPFAPIATSGSEAGGGPAAQRLKPRRNMLALESRIVFDGAAASADAPEQAMLRDSTVHALAQRLVGVAAEQRMLGLAADAVAGPDAAAPGGAGRSVLFVDSRIPGYQRIVDAAGEGVTVIVIDKNSNGMAQIAAALRDMQGLESVSIVSHGDDGMLLLGDTALVQGNLDQYRAELAALGAALAENGELLLYGCDVGAGTVGQAFINGLASMTGAVVAASTDSTGATRLGANWDLEISTGAITSAPVFDTSAVQDIELVLHTASVGTVADLKAAILAGQADGLDDLITLTANITFASAADALSIAVSDGKKMTIVGGGFTIDAAYRARAMLTSTSGAGAAIELQNLTITHGRVSGNGGNSGPVVAGQDGLGGAINNSGNLTLNSVTVTANFATGGGGGGGVIPGYYGGGGGGGSGANGIGGGNGGNSGLGGGFYSGLAGGSGNGGRGGGYDPAYMGGKGGTTSGGAGGIGTSSYANGGAGATAVAGGISVGGGGGGAGWDRSGGAGGNAVGGIFNSGTLSIIGTSVISNNAGAGGGGGGGGGAGNHGGIGGIGVGGILNSGAGATVRITAANFAAMSGNSGASGVIGNVTNGGSNDGFSSPTAAAGISNTNFGTTDTTYVPTPVVTDASISISGATGIGGAFKIGDTVTVTWNNTAGGDNNAGVTGVTMNLSAFGGGSAVVATLNAGVYSATYTIVAGALDAANRNVSVTASNASGPTTAADSTNATVDNIVPAVSDPRINISGATGAGGVFKIGDTVTATWNNSAGGDNNTDTISGVTVDFSAFGGGSAVAAINTAGTWTATYTITAGAIDAANRNVSVTVTDNAGNASTTADSTDAIVDNAAPVVTDANISIAGGTGTGGAFKIGDTVTVTWNNTAGGDNNPDTIGGVTVNFSAFGGGAAVAATNTAGTWTASYVITAGAVDAANRNVSVTATDNAGNSTTRVDSSNATVDNVAPVVTDPRISLTGGSGTGGAFKIGDTVTATWNNTAGGDNNPDTISGVTINFSAFGGGAAVVATNSAGIWTATYVITAGALDATGLNVSVTATDNAGNVTTTADSSNATVDSVAPVVTDASISIEGGSGPGGAFRIGDTITATWDNTAAGDNNADTIGGVTVNFASFGGGAAVVATNNAGIWTATFVITAGVTDGSARNVSVTATDNAGNSTTAADTSNGIVDNIAPLLTDANIGISGGSGPGGAYRIGDTVTATWNNTAGGDNNADTISGVSFDLSAFGGGAAVAAINIGGTWTATYVITAGALDAANRNVRVTATDNAGNTTTTADSSNATVDNAAPVVTDANISISGGSGAGGAFKVGDTVTVTWNNTAAGDNNPDTISGATVDFSAFGGGAAVAATNNAGTWTATYVIAAGALDAANRNVSVTATDNAGNATTTADSTNATVDSVAPVVSDANIGISGATGTGGAFKIGDTVTVTWNNTAAGDNNADTIGGVTVNFSAFGGGAAVAATNNAGIWTATYVVTAGIIDAVNSNVSVTATDNAGNTTTTADTSNASVDNIAPAVTDARISLSGGTGPGGAFRIGDTITATWNNTGLGDANADVISGVTVDFSAFGGGSAVAASNAGNSWSATYVVTAGGVTGTNRNVSVSATDNAGNVSTTADTSNAAIDAVRPTAAIVVSASALNAGQTALVTITFSEAVTGFTAQDLVVDGGTVGAVSSGDGGITWTATLTPASNTTLSGATVRLDTALVADQGGNAGSGTTTSNTYSVDTDLPSATIVLADTTLQAGETTLVTITFSELVTGFTNADLTVANGTLTNVSSSDGGLTYTATFTPTAGITDLSNMITLANAGVADLAGNAGTGTSSSANYAIDTAQPTATIVVADNALSIGESTLITITFSEAVSGLTVADLIVGNGVVTALSSTDGGITYTGLLTPNANTSASGNVVRLDNTGVADADGNAGVGTTDSNTYSVDTVRPTATIVVADTALAIGETSLVTITFSEAVIGFDNADLTIANGTLSAVATADGGVTWTATFTPTAGISDTTNTITLANTGVADAAGNAGAATTTSNNYVIDSLRATATIVLADTALAAGETTLVTITFTEAVTGFTNADLSVQNGTLSNLSSADGGITWTATFTPTAAIADTSNIITLDNTGVADLAGNAGTGTTTSANYSIDTARPTATIVLADSALSVGETSLVTITFSEAVSGFDNTDLTVANGTLGNVSSADGGITWTATFTPTSGISDTSNTITLDNTGVADAAGNAGTGITASANYSIDTGRPTATIVMADTALSIGETSLVTITFSEAVTGFTNADLTVANGTLGAVSSADGGITWTATFTPTAGIIDTSNAITLDNTGVSDLAGNAGSGATASANYAIDTARPTATIVIADTALAAGETSLVTITFTEAVTGFTNADLAIANGTLSAVTSADGGITWTATFTPAAVIADASNTITLDNTGVSDLAGNAGSGTTTSANYSIDTARPTATIVLADSALSVGETSLVTITFSEAVTGFDNADLTVANGTLSNVSSADGGVTWTATFTPTANLTSTTNVITLANTGVSDAAGNAGSGVTSSANYAIDTARPTATIVLADAALAAGETSLATITFTEAVTGFTNADLSVANGTLSNVSSADGGITWTATFTPTAGITDTSNAITLDNTGVADLAGNAGSGATASANYAIDTARPTATIVIADTALAAGETSLVTITFTEAVTGFTNADLAIANGTLSAVTSADGGITWTATFTPAAGIADASNTITLDNTGVPDLAGNAGSGTTTSANYSIDTARPTATIVLADSALSVGETSLVTITFSEAVTGFDNADLTVANGTLSAVSSSDGGITWTATFTPTAGITDTANTIILDNTGVADAAGNAGSGATSSANYAIDAARPSATVVVADTALAAGETSLVTITFSEAVTGFTNADLTIDNGTLSAVTSSDGGITWTATFTPAAGIADASNAITLAAASVQDAAGNANSASIVSNNYAIDTVLVIVPGAPQLAPSSDSGSSASDGITNDNTPLITGFAADGTTITLFDTDGVTVLGSAVASGGAWAITSAPLANGVHSLTVVASNNGANPSPRSGALQVTIDSVAPAAPGVPNPIGPGIVSTDPSPRFNGSGAEANAIITLSAGGVVVATVQADANGNWQSAPVSLGRGSFIISATATDAAGNTSAASQGRTLIVVGPILPPQPPMPVPRPFQPQLEEREEASAFAPVSLAISGPFSRTPLADTIAEAVSDRTLGYDLGPGPVFAMDAGGIDEREISVALPPNLFAGIELVSIRAQLAGGTPLPAWLQFDEARRTFSGLMPAGAPPVFTIEVIGIDKKGKEHRATIKVGAPADEKAAVKPQAAAAPEPARLSGIDLLAALGLQGFARGASDGAIEKAGEEPVQARALSGQLARESQRFSDDSDATLRHLKQIDNNPAASEHA